MSWTEMYARGLSTRDIEDALRDATGDAMLSRTAVSQVTDRLWEDYEAFCERDLSGFEVEYLFLDAIYESLRRQAGLKEGLLCAWAICRDGSKVLLHLALGNRESEEAWLDFLRDMVRRGLRHPVLVVSDGAPGLLSAIQTVFPRALRQRCLRHKMQNILAKVPDSAQPEVKAEVRAAYQAPNVEVAELVAARVLEKYAELYPSAMKSFREDWEACVAYLRCPMVHHRRIRTTNVIERAFGEQRRRTKVIPRFFTERSCLKLAWVSLWQASQRWRGVRMTDLEIQQLKALRRELGIPPTPGGGRTASVDEFATEREQAA